MFSEVEPMKKAPFALYPFFKIRGLIMPRPPVSPNIFSSVVVEEQWLVATLGEENER